MHHAIRSPQVPLQVNEDGQCDGGAGGKSALTPIWRAVHLRILILQSREIQRYAEVTKFDVAMFRRQ